MKFYSVTGISHKSAPLPILEKAREFIRADRDEILLSTCNRYEIYSTKGPLRSDLPFVYRYENFDALIHLFRVAAGLESQVLGENEVLGQIKEAYWRARESDMVPGALYRLFEAAIRTGKLVRAKTQISKGNISIASLAIRLIGELEDKRVLLVGTGKVTTVVCRHLKERRAREIVIVGRNYIKASGLVSSVNGRAHSFRALAGELRRADIVISATSAPHLVIHKEDIEDIHRPMVIIDLAVPRDVDERVGDIPGVRLYNIEDLKRLKLANYKNRLIEARKASIIVEEQAERFWKGLLCRDSELAQEAVG